MSATNATERLFLAVTGAPRRVAALCLLAIIATCAGLMHLHKDTSVDAFIPPDHPSILSNEEAKAVFGLSDPIVIALIAPDSIFRPDSLETIARLHEAIADLPNVRDDRVMSLASESSIVGFSDHIAVERYLEALGEQTDLDALKRRWRAMPPHVGTLVSDDERGAVIVAELKDQQHADESYDAIMALLGNLERGDLEVHVAGQGAVVGHLSSFIDSDSRVLQPLIFLTVLLIVFTAFRTAIATALPLLIIIGAAGGAIGIMAFQGVSYYAITSALPVILVAVAVADTIHILTDYYVRRAAAPDGDARPLVVASMSTLAQPITVTTLTTAAGFMGIALAEVMPPIVHFARYAACGVLLAWLYSMLMLPAIMVLIQPAASPRFVGWSPARPDRVTRILTAIASWTARRPLAALGLMTVVLAAVVSGISHLRVDRALVEGFKVSSAIRQADEAINDRFAGTSFLDVMIRTDEAGGLLTVSAMRQIAELQRFMESLPRVQHTMAITDYLSLLHRALDESAAAADPEARPLPEVDAAIAQYLLVYEASGDPTDFEEELDGSYQQALVRGVLNTRYFSEEQRAVEALEGYLARHFANGPLTAELSGRVNVRYHWMVRLAEHHRVGVALSLLLVGLIAALLFRSAGAGMVAVLPVSLTVLCLYGVMGWSGIYLEPATTMFAAISLGVGVDFAIHLVARLRSSLEACSGDLDRAMALALPETVRACFFNALALGLGFSVLLFSELLTLQRFGAMVATAAFLSFLWALVLIPALYGLRSRWKEGRLRWPSIGAAGSRVTLAAAALTGLLALEPAASHADSESATAAGSQPAATLTGLEIAERMQKRADGENVIREVAMTMTNRRGQARSRQALILRREDDEERRTLIVFTGPKAVRETAFLGFDYHEVGRDDDQWLYLPAMRKTRRIPSSDRGDYFLGTDFTYEDMQSELKFDLDDYDFTSRGRTEAGDGWHLVGVPKSDRIARALGYGGFTAVIDGESWIPRQIKFKGRKGQPLKTITVGRCETVDGVWTAMEITAENHQTGHQTQFDYDEVRYPDALAADLFQTTRLNRGVPKL